jgi:hypothetical protein
MRLVFAFYGQALLAVDDEWGLHDVREAYRTVGIWRTAPRSHREEIADLSGWLAASCALLAIEVLLWTISIIG